MLKGQYLNPKYARRQKTRRRFIVAAATVSLCVCCTLAIWRVDTVIRATMLPYAQPVAELREEAPAQYHLQFFGYSYRFSLQWLDAFQHELDGVLRTPPAPVRLFYQLRAQLGGTLPRNRRDSPRISLEV